MENACGALEIIDAIKPILAGAAAVVVFWVYAYVFLKF